MVSITNYPYSKPLRSLGGIPQNLARRIPPARSRRFQDILSGLETRNFKIIHKTRGLTIADYRARAVVPKSRYRRLPRPADVQLKNPVSRSGLKAASNRFPALTATTSTPPLNKSRPQPAALTDRQRIKQTVQKAAAKYNLPPELITAVIRAESNFKTGAVSSAGAQGLMQLMPATAKELGVQNPFDIEQNIDGGTKYLRKMLDRFGGSVPKALAAYNAGPGTVMKYNGRVPYPETRQYVRRVLRFSRQTT
jgi:soluble lytic murein transglycosylase-like protein